MTPTTCSRRTRTSTTRTGGGSSTRGTGYGAYKAFGCLVKLGPVENEKQPTLEDLTNDFLPQAEEALNVQGCTLEDRLLRIGPDRSPLVATSKATGQVATGQPGLLSPSPKKQRTSTDASTGPPGTSSTRGPPSATPLSTAAPAAPAIIIRESSTKTYAVPRKSRMPRPSVKD